MNSDSNSGGSSRDTVHIAGSRIKCPCHICALFNSDEEQYAVLFPFIREGLARGERFLQFLDGSERENRLNRLKACGIDVEFAQRSGQLEIEIWENAYLRDGRFDAGNMLELVQETLATGVRRGFPRTRLWANMEWALSEAPGVDDLDDYESRLNYFLPHYGDAVVCVYDVRRFSASLLEKVIRSHPYVLADDWIQRNPHYVPPA